MKLFYSTTSPFVRKVLVLAHELGLAEKIEKIPAKAHPVNREVSLVAKNPLGKVPALILEDGGVLYDSRVIAEYLDHVGGGGFFPAAGAARWRTLTEQALADGLLDAALLIRYERFVRPPDRQWKDWEKGQFEKVETALGAIEGLIPQLGFTIGAITIACALGYLDFRYPELGWRQDHPKAARWFAEFEKRPSMQVTMPS